MSIAITETAQLATIASALRRGFASFHKAETEEVLEILATASAANVRAWNVAYAENEQPSTVEDIRAEMTLNASPVTAHVYLSDLWRNLDAEGTDAIHAQLGRLFKLVGERLIARFVPRD